MPSLRLRWSEQEARKPYARPFMVSFLDDAGELLGSVAMSGSDLLYLRQFVAAVAELSGELFILAAVEAAADPQRAWLDSLAAMLPSADGVTVHPRSTFDHDRGRVFGFVVTGPDGAPQAVVDAATLLEYQELQAALAHQAGRLLRVPAVEMLADPAPRRLAWLEWLHGVVARPAPDEAMSPAWPWR